METIFDLRDVSYTYIKRFEALKNVTLSFKAGEQTAILGANGSGKSTLLSILNALTYPTSGEFSAFGTPIKEEVFDTLEDNEFARFFRKKVGFLFQNPDIQLFSSNVFDEIAFGPLQLDLPPDEVQKRTEEVIAMLGIENLRDRAPHEEICRGTGMSPCQVARGFQILKGHNLIQIRKGRKKVHGKRPNLYSLTGPIEDIIQAIDARKKEELQMKIGRLQMLCYLLMSG